MKNRCFDRLISSALSGVLPVFFLFLGLVPAAGQADDSVLRQVRAGAMQIRSLQAEFVQKKQMKILLKPLISAGRFFYQAPGSIRWEYHTPVSSVVLMHRGKIKRYFSRDGKMVADSGASLQAMQVVMQNITGWLGGHFADNPDFRVDIQGGRIILTPLKPMPGIIDHIELVLSRHPGVIDGIFIYEDSENFTRIDFTNLKINQPIEESVFLELP